MQIFGVLTFVTSQITLEFINKDFYSSVDEFSIVRKYIYSDYSLLEGILATRSPALKNLRFYGPNVKRYFRERNSSWFSPDPTKDGLCLKKKLDFPDLDKLGHVVCKLFPSIGLSYINIHSQYLSNFALLLEQSKSSEVDESSKHYPEYCYSSYISFLGSMIYACSDNTFHVTSSVTKTVTGMVLELQSISGKSKAFYLDYTHKIIQGGKRSDEECIRNLNWLISIKKESVDTIFSPSVIIKAFTSLFLTKSSEVYALYKFIDEELVPFFETCELEDDIAQSEKLLIENALTELSTITDSTKSYNMAPVYFSMPFYLGNGSFDESGQTFSNCAESALYYFLDSLLWDPVKSQYIQVFYDENGKKKLTKLSRFFTGSTKACITSEVFREWHTLVQDIEGGKIMKKRLCSENDSSYFDVPFDHVYYRNDINGVKNELHSGLINSLKVIEYLTERNGECTGQIKYILKKNEFVFENAKNEIFQVLKTFFFDLIGCTDEEQNVTFEIEDVSEFTMLSESRCQLEILGSFILTKTIDSKREIRTKLNISKYHQDVDINYVNDYLNEKSSGIVGDIKNLLTKHDTQHKRLVKMMLYNFLSDMDSFDLSTSTLTFLSKNGIKIGCFDFLWIKRFSPSDETAQFFEFALDFLSPDRVNKEYFVKTLNNFFLSIPLNDEITFSFFLPLLTRNIDLFYTQKCIANDYFLTESVDRIFYINDPEEKGKLVSIWKEVCNGYNLDKYGLTDAILRFLNRVGTHEDQLDPEIFISYFNILSNLYSVVFWSFSKKLKFGADNPYALNLYAFTCKPSYIDPYFQNIYEGRFYSRAIDIIQSKRLQQIVIERFVTDEELKYKSCLFSDYECIIIKHPQKVQNALRFVDKSYHNRMFLSHILIKKPYIIDKIAPVIEKHLYSLMLYYSELLPSLPTSPESLSARAQYIFIIVSFLTKGKLVIDATKVRSTMKLLCSWFKVLETHLLDYFSEKEGPIWCKVSHIETIYFFLHNIARIFVHQLKTSELKVEQLLLELDACLPEQRYLSDFYEVKIELYHAESIKTKDKEYFIKRFRKCYSIYAELKTLFI